jgi:formate dehydrogenase alpha subunit
MTNSISEFEDADLFLVTGSNTTAQHPLIGSRIINAVERGAKLILIDPREIPLAAFAELHLQQTIGTDIAVLNGLMNIIIQENLYDREFVEARTEGFEALKKAVGRYTPSVVELISGIRPAALIRAAEMYARADKAMLAYAMGITQHVTGTDNVKACANLAMLTGHVGRPSTGVNPLRGQNNVQGACDMGGLPGVFSGYQPVADEAARKKFENAWGVKGLSERPGLTLGGMLEACRKGDLKALYVMGENPRMSDPNLGSVDMALSSLDLLIVQDIFLSETAALADVVLPAACFAEKGGTYTNTERRVQLSSRAVAPPGQARPDWEIIADLCRLFGLEAAYSNPAEIMQEISSLTPSYGGICHGRLAMTHGLQWPCPNRDHPGTSLLHSGQFTRGRGSFQPSDFVPHSEAPDQAFPFTLSTGRIYCQFHTGTMSRRIGLLEREAPEPLVEIHPEDAAPLGIRTNDLVEVSSRRGAIRLKAEVTSRVPRKVLFTTFHFHEAQVNLLTNPACDRIAGIPELKECAAAIRRCM